MRQYYGTILCVAVALLAGCQREQRSLRPLPANSSVMQQLPPESGLYPGGVAPAGQIDNPYAGNAWAIAQGQRLFDWFNCSGCHGGYGGGAIGPALNDKVWVYGGEPAQIFDSIARGRPNGMPAWGARIPRDQIWQLVAYVRSLSGEEPKSATPARSDGIEPTPFTIQNKVKGETR